MATPPAPDKGKCDRRQRQLAAFLVLPMLAGCVGGAGTGTGTVGYVEGFLGGVIADEPRAALIGREILSAGGNAADAAVAVYFSLAVTLPSSAGLGGGGVCIAHDREKGKTETLDFMARAPRRILKSASRPTAIPGNARGFFALHSKYGRLAWGQLLSPAENLGRFGVPVSRAFNRDIVQVKDALMTDPETARIFGRSNGTPLAEGDNLIQLDLAALIGRLRTRGVGQMYSGPMARQLVKAVSKAGGTLTTSELRNFIPKWRTTVQVPLGNHVVHFPLPPAAAGPLAAGMFAMLEDRYNGTADDEKQHLFAETAMRAYADRAAWMRGDGSSGLPIVRLSSMERFGQAMANYRADRHTPALRLSPRPVRRGENPSATGFVIVDREGSAVACALTMNNLFGTGRVAPGTGLLLAAMPGPGGRGPQSLGPMMMVNPHTGEFFYAATSTGGVTAPTALINVAARTLLGGEPLTQAIAAKRVHHGGVPDLTYIEQGTRDAVAKSLTGRGHDIATTAVIGQVNAISCPGGLPPRPGSCIAVADPRGFGLAATAD